MQSLHPIKIQHALNGGEKRIQRQQVPGYCYYVDGYYEDPQSGEKVCLEFLGCLYHGCLLCYQATTSHPYTKQTMSELHYVTLKRIHELRQMGFKVIVKWEHQYIEDLKENKDMDQFVSNLNIQTPLDPREGFYGGRTNAVRLHYKVSEGEEIKYYDVRSLYPTVLKKDPFPTGHPVIITENFDSIDKYFGFAKVTILPPRSLYHPVLPYKSNGKLKFPLCRTCADIENMSDPCSCSPQERSITGTWVTLEILKALEKGYTIMSIWEIYHFPDVNNKGIFSEYVDTFFKLKEEASGPPNWCKTEEQMDEHLKNYIEKEGIILDREQIKHNPGLRSLCKLILNSMWGKFGQRPNFRRHKFVDREDEFLRLLLHPLKDVKDFAIITSDVARIEWAARDDTPPECSASNVFIAAFTCQ